MPTLNDSWLAGFIDAEGSFIVSIVGKKNYATYGFISKRCRIRVYIFK